MAAENGERRDARTTRPRNRRALIITAAAELFYRHGYARVAVSDIAEAVGIGPSALYRHFPGKQQLLQRVVLDQLRPFEEVVADADPGDLGLVARRLSTVALDNRQVGVLWQREARQLPDEQRAALKDQLRAVATRLAGLAREHQPEITDEDARFRAWCLFSALTSPSYHRVELPRPAFEALLRNMVIAVVEQPPLVMPARRRPDGSRNAAGSLLERGASRRRLLLSAATRLFAEHGYATVTTEDIGTAVGIAGPSVYNHFASKRELLGTVINRGSSWLEIELERTLTATLDVEDALRELLRSYVAFALDHGSFIDIMISEVDHLPEWERHRARQIQREYVSEWVALLREARPELDVETGRILVQAALTTANDMARTGTLRDADALLGITQALMLRTSAKSS